MLKSWRTKVDWLDNNLAPDRLEEIRRAFKNSAEPWQTEASPYPAALWQAIEVELIYACVRHQAWLGVRLFEHSLAEHIKAQFRIPQDIFERLYEALRLAFPTSATHVERDYQFARYLLVCMLTTGSDADPVTEIGLGRDLLKRIKGIIDRPNAYSGEPVNSSKDSSPADKQVYAFHGPDKLFLQALNDLTQLCRTRPSALDEEQLRYLYETNSSTDETSSQTLTTIKDNYGNGIYPDPYLVLEFAVSAGSFPLAKIVKLVEGPNSAKGSPKTSAIEGKTYPSEHYQLVVDSLVGLGLLFQEGAAKVAGHIQAKWRISPRGLNLVARSAATKITAEKNLTATKVCAYPPIVQQRIVENLTTDHINLLEDLAGGFVAGLGPKAWEESLRILATCRDRKTVAQKILALASADTPAWLQKPACRQLLAYTAPDEGRPLLEQLASSAKSPTVRAAANQALGLLEAV